MSANNIDIIINEVVVVAEAVEPELELPVTMAELLEEDFTNDDEAEFLQGVLSIQQDIENVILSDNPEEFLLPTDDDLPPALLLLEKIDELKSYKFGDRTLARMERRIRGQNEVVKTKLTESEKANHPDYRICPKCERYFTKRYLGFHIDTPICVKVASAHRLRPVDKKIMVSDKIYNAVVDMETLYDRAVKRQVHIRSAMEEELEEEDIEEETTFEYVVKTYDKENNYAGLFELDCVKCWTTEAEAREAFNIAIQTGEMGAVELVEINPDSEIRENVIGEWEQQFCDKCDNKLDIDDLQLVDILKERVESFEPSADYCKDCWVNDFYVEMKDYPENTDAAECYDIASNFCGYCYKDGVTKV